MSSERQGRRWTEEIEVTGRELVGLIEDLVREGSVRRIIIRNQEGQELIEIPVTIGAAVGGAAVILAPALAAVGAIAALIARVRVEIVRDEEAQPDERGEGRRQIRERADRRE